MKRATIREVQHNLSGVLKWVEDGEEVQVMRRNRVVAIVIPAEKVRMTQPLPEFEKRAAAVWSKRPRGKAASRILVESRAERL
jgi:antitoxin (DNA-binding transcriptional repressor) of toxin-antitoxin stability system